MTYVISDIHGNLTRYRLLLNRLELKEDDELIILGDIVDRGPHGIEILLDIINNNNISMILGNHDALARDLLRKVVNDVSLEAVQKLFVDDVLDYTQWIIRLGGDVTFKEFSQLTMEDRKKVLDFLDCVPLYKELTVNNQKYLLVHGGLGDFSPEKHLDDYEEDDITWERPDYGKVYFEDTILVTGHTPTCYIDQNLKPNYIYKANNHIAIDCGCGFEQGRLGCICLDTMEEIYV